MIINLCSLTTNVQGRHDSPDLDVPRKRPQVDNDLSPPRKHAHSGNNDDDDETHTHKRRVGEPVVVQASGLIKAADIKKQFAASAVRIYACIVKLCYFVTIPDK